MTASVRTPERTSPSAPRGEGLRLDVQGLRAVAVLAVVLDHAGVPGFSGGFAGVDVFFVLSGFLITTLMVREAERTGRVSLTGFYARRARRILPAATVVLLVVLLWSALALPYTRVDQVTVDVGWAAAFLANVHFADLGTDYFAEGLATSPVQHYWSLSVEEQFYLVWPPVLLVLLLWLQRRSGRGRPARHATGRRGGPWPTVAAVVAALCLASLAWSVLHTRTDGTAAYFSSLTRAWELGAGVLLAVLAPRLHGLGRRARQVLAAGGLLAVAVAVVGFDTTTPFPGHHALLPVLGTVAVIAAGIGTDAVGAARALTVRPMTWVGDVSYSLYLWHWPVLVLWEAQTGPERGPIETAALLVLALALATASYHLVENPARRLRWLGRPRWRSLVLWPAALVLVGVGVLGARGLAENRLDDRLEANARYAELREAQVPVADELADALDRADAAAPVAFPLTDLDQLEDLTHDLWHERYRCNAQPHERSTDVCPVGDVDADRSIVVTGDSHAGQWLPALDLIGQDHGWRVVPLVKFGCSPYDVGLRTDGGTRDYTECHDFRAWVAEEVARLQPDVVVLGGRGLQRNMAAPPEARPRVYADGVAATVRRLAPLTSSLLVVSDVSPLGIDPVECLTDAEATMRTCTSAEVERVVQGNAITAETAEENAARYVDVSALACLHGRCPAVAGGRMVYGNLDHLSVSWVEHVTPDLTAALDLPAR